MAILVFEIALFVGISTIWNETRTLDHFSANNNLKNYVIQLDDKYYPESIILHLEG